MPKLAIVVTDGVSSSKNRTKEQARLAHRAGITLMAVGVGKNTDQQELQDIASDPDSKYLFHIDTFVGLKMIESMLASSTCTRMPCLSQEFSPLPIFIYCNWNVARCTQFIFRLFFLTELKGQASKILSSINNCKLVKKNSQTESLLINFKRVL